MRRAATRRAPAQPPRVFRARRDRCRAVLGADLEGGPAAAVQHSPARRSAAPTCRRSHRGRSLTIGDD